MRSFADSLYILNSSARFGRREMINLFLFSLMFIKKSELGGGLY